MENSGHNSIFCTYMFMLVFKYSNDSYVYGAGQHYAVHVTVMILWKVCHYNKIIETKAIYIYGQQWQDVWFSL